MILTKKVLILTILNGTLSVHSLEKNSNNTSIQSLVKTNTNIVITELNLTR